MVKRLDEGLGRILDALKSLGLTEKAVALFTSDHGCQFKTRNAEYKRFLPRELDSGAYGASGTGIRRRRKDPSAREAWSICRQRCWMRRESRCRRR